jgi:hypothetical protein
VSSKPTSPLCQQQNAWNRKQENLRLDQQLLSLHLKKPEPFVYQENSIYCPFSSDSFFLPNESAPIAAKALGVKKVSQQHIAVLAISRNKISDNEDDQHTPAVTKVISIESSFKIVTRSNIFCYGFIIIIVVVIIIGITPKVPGFSDSFHLYYLPFTNVLTKTSHVSIYWQQCPAFY